MTKLVSFESLEVGQRFFDPTSGEFMIKVCGNAADFTKNGDCFSGCFATFEADEPVEVD